MNKTNLVFIAALFFAKITMCSDVDAFSNCDQKLIVCTVTKEDLQNTYAYQTLSCAQTAISICEICRVMGEIYNGEEEGFISASSFALSAMVFFPVSYLIERLIGTITLKLAQGRVITNREILGLLLYFEERLRVPVFLFAADVAGSLVQLPTAQAAPLIPNFRNATTSFDPCEFQVCQSACVTNFSKAKCPSYELAVNLMFINPTPRTPEHGMFFLGAGTPEEQLAEFNTTIVQPIVEVAHAMTKKTEVVIFWIDHNMMTPNVFEQSRNVMCQLLTESHVDAEKVLLRTIRDIPEIAAAPDIFSSDKLIYWLCDLGRLLAALLAIEQMGVKNSLYKDLDMKIGVPSNLLTRETLKNLDKFGVAFASNGRGHVINGLFIVRRDTGLRTHIVERSMEWIRNGYVTNSDESFVYGCTYLWWAAQFGLSKADMSTIDELKHNWSTSKLLKLLKEFDIDKYGKFFRLIDPQKELEMLDEYNSNIASKFLIEVNLMGCLEAIEACSNPKSLECLLGAMFCHDLMAFWSYFMPRLENTDGLYLSAARRDY